MPVNTLYFMQHGMAVDKAEDAERPLSPEGIHNTTAIAKTLKRNDIAISEVFHSGKLRALQTADIIADELDIPANKHEFLSPNDDARLLAQKLDTDGALYVGHLPQMQKIVDYLITGNEDAQLLRFTNSALVCLEKQGRFYLLNGYLTPEFSCP